VVCQTKEQPANSSPAVRGPAAKKTLNNCNHCYGRARNNCAKKAFAGREILLSDYFIMYLLAGAHLQ